MDLRSAIERVNTERGHLTEELIALKGRAKDSGSLNRAAALPEQQSVPFQSLSDVYETAQTFAAPSTLPLNTMTPEASLMWDVAQKTVPSRGTSPLVLNPAAEPKCSTLTGPARELTLPHFGVGYSVLDLPKMSGPTPTVNIGNNDNHCDC